MVVGTLAAIATGTSQPLQIVIFGDILNSFNQVPSPGAAAPDPDAMLSGITKVAIRFVWLGVAVFFTGLAQVACWSITASRQAKRVREEYVHAILSQEIGWFDVNDSMTLATKVADRMLTIQNGMGRKMGEGINFAAMAASGILIGLIKGWKLALALIAFTPFLAGAGFFMVRSLTSAIKRSIDAYGSAGAVAEEALSSIRTVHSFNLLSQVSTKYDHFLQFAEKAGIQKGLTVGLGTGIMFGFMLCTYSFGMFYGTVLVAADQLGEKPCTGSGCYDGGRVMTVFSCIIMGAMGLGQAGPSLQAVVSARAAAFDVFQVIDRESKINPSSDKGLKLESVRGEIELESVSFRYPSRPDVAVCDNYSLRIAPGQQIAFVGPSGSGKSTIVSLIERFYDPDSGKVILDGHDLKELCVGWLRDQIGLVGQEPTLFADTIAANIAHGKPGATEQEVINAAKQANAFAFISAFPDGFQTQAGERGLQLSGGQKQRIAIARAIIKNPAILLLDEATSALDTESERIVQASLDSLLATRKRTTIIIAHRLSTIRDVDRIIVISSGRIVEDGPHQALMQLPGGHYRALVEIQEKASSTPKPEARVESAILKKPDPLRTSSSNAGRIRADSKTVSQITSSVEATDLDHDRDSDWVQPQPHSATTSDHDGYPEPRDSVTSFVSSSRYATAGRNTSVVTTFATTTFNNSNPSDSNEGEHGKSETFLRLPKSKESRARHANKKRARVWRLSLPDIKFIIAGVIGGAVNSATFPTWGVLMTKVVVLFYDRTLTANEMKTKGQVWSIAFLILAVTYCASIVLQNYSFAVVSERLTTRVRSKVFQAMLRQEVGWFDLDENSSGALTARLATDCAILQSMTSDSLNRTLVTLMTLAIGFGIAFYHSWQMTLVLLAIFPVLGIATQIQMRLILGGNVDPEQRTGDVLNGALLSEAIGGIRTVASFHMEPFVYATYRQLLDASGKSEYRAGIMSGAGFGFAQGVVFCACGFLFWYGGTLVSKATISFEDMFMVIICIMFSAMSLGVATQNVADSKRVQDAAHRVFETLDRVPPINAAIGMADSGGGPGSSRREASVAVAPKDSGKILHAVKGDLELCNVTFAYPNRKATLIYKNYSLKIPSGKTVALVGVSGCGKSTAIALIERFYDPLQGQVLLDGHDLRDLNLSWLREHISLVSQEPVLFMGSIADNIGGGKRGATRDDIVRAAQMANAHDFIMSFPQQYDTSVGDRGAQLSGGQKQRIAIARAILRDPEVLLLDEATSALDNESERVVQESLDRLLALKKRTTVVVAHRLTTIRNADIIAVAHEGKIVEQGTHDALMKTPNGRYRALVTRQTGETGSSSTLL
ncbi:hypothetical protein Gpo141_00008086 [Globisporangium polare]